MPDSATVGIREHEHGPEQPAELRDVVSVPAVARVTVLRVVGVSAWVLRVVDLGHARHIYTP